MSVSFVTDAEAKRLGGGKSFGSKPAQSQTAKRTGSASQTPTKAQQQNTTRKQDMAKKGGMMGLLGGLMIGGMLGALFFGGAFENINFMDILLFGLIAFALFKIFTRRKQGQPVTANGAPMNDDSTDSETFQTRQSYTESGSSTPEDNVENILPTGKIPRDFDQKSFLNGADNVYNLLQEAWDKKELSDLREFCTDSVFAELQDQIKTRSGENRTEIVSLRSELVNVIPQDNKTEATVVFNVTLREFDDATDETPEIIETQEAWHFLRPNNRHEHVWLLDGIQQLED